MNDTEVIDRLTELGEAIDRHFSGVDLSAPVLGELDRVETTSTSGTTSRRSRRLLLVAAALVVVIAITAALPGPRRTVARWFGIGSVEVRTVPESGAPGSSPATPDETVAVDVDALGPAVDPEQAMAATDLPLPVATSLGEPASWHLPGGRQIVARYPAGDETVLVAVLGGATDSGEFRKEVTAGDASRVLVDGARGVWLTGREHTFSVVDENGVVAAEPVRMAADTLVWERDGRTYRVEGAASLDEALTIARSVELRSEP